MFHEYETFRLKQPLPGETIPVGQCGVVLMLFDSSPREYEVEFPDDLGGNLGSSPTYTITEDFMEKLVD